MNKPKVWDDPIERPRLLKTLGLEESILLLGVEQGQAAYANCTLNHPALYRGVTAWAEAIRSLRESMIPLGWKRYDVSNQPFILNEAGTIAITVATGDEFTGIKGVNPSTKSSKGPKTEIAITNNHLAYTLFGDIRRADLKNMDGRVTWILLFYRDEKNSQIRSELSVPSKRNREGQVVEWSERIILAPIEFTGKSINISDENPQTPKIDIEIKRRRA